jgi:prohibitin 1
MKMLTRLYLFLLGSLFLLLMLAPYILVFVEAGEASVLFRRFFGGVVTTQIYGEGIHIIFPWDKMTIYDVRIQEKSINYTVLSKNGLTINLDLSVRYHPEYDTLGILHKKVGPHYLDKVIVPEVEGAVRKTAGKYAAEELYSSQGPLIHQIESEVRAQLGQYFIYLDGIAIKKIELPKVIREAIEAKEEQREILEAYQYRLRSEKEEAIRKQIEALGWSNFNVIVGRSISQRLLQWRGIEATTELAKSNNSKVVIIGNGENGMPVILGSDYTSGENPKLEKVEPNIPSGASSIGKLEGEIEEVRTLFDELLRQNRPQNELSKQPETNTKRMKRLLGEALEHATQVPVQELEEELTGR